jgi:hypothetical protein
MGRINSIGSWFEKITGGWIFGSQTNKLTFKGDVEIQGGTGNYEHTFQSKNGTVAHLVDISDGLETKIGVTQVTSISILASNWVLVSGLYEYELSNANITSTSIVEAIPDNSAIDIVKAAELLPKTDSSAGSVKFYAKNLPTGNFTITINIYK